MKNKNYKSKYLFKDYQKVAGCLFWFGKRVALAKIIKDSYYKGHYSDAGGKIEKGENIYDALLREIREETGLVLGIQSLNFIDTFIYPERKKKIFLFECKLPEEYSYVMRNMEPDKLGPWIFLTRKQALKRPLLPSIRFYLESIK